MKEHTRARQVWPGDVVVATGRRLESDEADIDERAQGLVISVHDGEEFDETWSDDVVIQVRDARGDTQRWRWHTEAWVQLEDNTRGWV